ncbi:MAG: hypothetical protein ACFE8A_15260 [Candidatus Hodarchaeota archaeon]
MPIERIILFINNNFDMILEEFSQKEIEEYRTLRQQFERLNGAVVNNRDFQKEYTRFYGIKFYQEEDLEENCLDIYFNIISNEKLQVCVSQFRNLHGFKKIFLYIYSQIEKIVNKNEFSYTTKLINTINPIFPIYDEYIKIALGLDEISSQRNKKEISWRQFNQIMEIYNQLLVNKDFINLLNLFESNRDFSGFSDFKKADFIIRCMGKVIQKVRRLNQYLEGRIRSNENK